MDIQRTVYAILRGLYDSIRGITAIFYIDREINEKLKSRLSPTHSSTPIRRRSSDIAAVREATPARNLKKYEESKVAKRIIQCGFLNGALFLLSILMFEYAFLPTINAILFIVFGENDTMAHNVWSWIHPILSLIFKTVWVVPLFLLSKIVNSLWFQDIADSAYRHARGRPIFMQGLSRLLADSIFSIVIQTLFLVQALIVNYIPIPILGPAMSFVHMCLLYSLYAFEYKWFNMGWELHKRLSFIELNWPYFLGFGIPLTVFTEMTDSWIISGCVFSILFPFFIISGNDASPVDNVCIFPLRLFSFVITLSNLALAKSIGRDPAAKPATPARPQRSTSVDSQRSSISQGSRGPTWSSTPKGTPTQRR